MKVTIITVTYNSAATLRNTIESVITQIYPNIEYIIVDGNSTDGTQEIIKSYGKKVSHSVSEPDSGMYDAMNKGIKIATGDVVGILNSDDLYAHPNVIENVVSAFNKNGVSAVYGDLVYVKRNDLSVVQRHWKSGNCTQGKMYHSFWQPPHPALFLKSEVYRKTGLFDLQYIIAADTELMVRIFYVHRITHHYLAEVFVKMRTGGVSNNGINSRKRLIKEYFSIIKYHHLQLPFYAIPIRIFQKILQYF